MTGWRQNVTDDQKVGEQWRGGEYCEIEESCDSHDYSSLTGGTEQDIYEYIDRQDDKRFC